MRRLPDSAGGVLSYFTRHRTAANLLLVILIVAGLVAFPRMRAQFFPDVVIDNVTISVAWDGAGAEDVDRSIVAPGAFIKTNNLTPNCFSFARVAGR